MQKGYIYKITSPSNKVYIGQTINIHKRMLKYKRLGCSQQHRIHNSLVKYGVDNHTFEVIEECKFEMLNIRERYWQDHYNVIGDYGLNCVLTSTDVLPRVTSQETRNKISKSKIGKKLSKEHVELLSRLRTGIKHTEETKIKMSKSNRRINLGRKFSDEVNKKKGSPGEKHPLYGIGHSIESRLKMSESHKGKKRSEESIKKFIKSIKGKMTYGDNPMSKLVLNIESGIYYTSMKEARDYSCPNISLHMIYKMISGDCKNKSNLIYV